MLKYKIILLLICNILKYKIKNFKMYETIKF